LKVVRSIHDPFVGFHNIWNAVETPSESVSDTYAGSVVLDNELSKAGKGFTTFGDLYSYAPVWLEFLSGSNWHSVLFGDIEFSRWLRGGTGVYPGLGVPTEHPYHKHGRSIIDEYRDQHPVLVKMTTNEVKVSASGFHLGAYTMLGGIGSLSGDIISLLDGFPLAEGCPSQGYGKQGYDYRADSGPLVGGKPRECKFPNCFS